MSNTKLPLTWVEVPLNDICEPKQWKTISKSDLKPSGYTVYGANGVIGFYDDYTHEKPTLMITCRGATCGNLHISEPFSYINGNAMAIDKLSEDVCDLRFLYYFLKTRGFKDVISGSAQPQITQEGLSKIMVSLAPLKEQKRIADKLDKILARVDVCCEHLDRVSEILKRFRQAVLSAATTGILTTKWSGKHDIWESYPLGSVISDLRYGTSKKSSQNLPNGIPVLRIPNIGNGKLNRTGLKFGHFDKKELENLSLRRGDLLLIRSNGSVDLVGKVAEVSSEFEGYAYAGYLIRLRFDATKVNPSYIRHFLSSPTIRKYIELTSRSTSGVNNINSDEVKAIPLKLPPLLEQNEIVRRVEILFTYADQLESRFLGAYKLVDDLTPVLLAKAFRGELVPQNPNDEPAEILFERIRVERLNQPKEIEKPRRRLEMKIKDNKPISVIKALNNSLNELSSNELFQAAGYPLDAEPEEVEAFFVDLRDSMQNNKIKKKRIKDEDYFSLIK